MFTSSEFPTQIEALDCNHVGNPALAKSMAALATERGVLTLAGRQRLTVAPERRWCS